MKNFEKFNRALFFSLFSAIGLFSLALATLGPEWKNLYKVKSATKQVEQNNGRIEQLLEDHEVLIGRINKDPEMLKRLAPVTLGEKSRDANQPDVKMTADTLDRAKEALAESTDEENPKGSEQEIPVWLQRATSDQSRMVLFVAGGGLVLVSFVCFGAKKD
jgi:TolA-binding protein